MLTMLHLQMLAEAHVAELHRQAAKDRLAESVQPRRQFRLPVPRISPRSLLRGIGRLTQPTAEPQRAS